MRGNHLQQLQPSSSPLSLLLTYVLTEFRFGDLWIILYKNVL